MFGRTKEREAPVIEVPQKAGGKNRPTPRRSTAEAANRRPLVAKDRRGATAASRTMTREDRRRAQEGRMAGDDQYLPARDRGPVKAFVRDIVDSRYSLSQWCYPFILVVFVAEFVLQKITGSITVTAILTYLVYATLFAVIIDCVLLRSRLRREITARFGAAALRGTTMYAVTRAVQPRRMRVPRAAVRAGQAPR